VQHIWRFSFIIFPSKTSKNGFPHRGPNFPQTDDFKILILHYIRKLLCKLAKGTTLALTVLLKRRFLKTFFTCKIVSNIVAPPDLSGTMILIDLILHYVRKLSCKFELFWIIGS
jgi:hypothetical protein